MHNITFELLCILAYEQSVSQMGVKNLTPNCIHEILKNFSNDTDVTQQKFISQLVIQNGTYIHHFDSDSEQQSMQWNERIGQNCNFVTLRKSVFSTSNANNRRMLKCTNYLKPKSHIVHVVF